MMENRNYNNILQITKLSVSTYLILTSPPQKYGNFGSCGKKLQICEVAIVILLEQVMAQGDEFLKMLKRLDLIRRLCDGASRMEA